MSSPKGMKSSGRDYSPAAKRAAVEREIIRIKKAVKRRGVFSGAAEQMDVLRSIARDYRSHEL